MCHLQIFEQKQNNFLNVEILRFMTITNQLIDKNILGNTASIIANHCSFTMYCTILPLNHMGSSCCFHSNPNLHLTE